MSTQNVRGTNGSRIVLTASERYHHHGEHHGRECPVCGVRWTVQRDANEDFHIWRDGVPADAAILDWIGNNVAIECCRIDVDSTGSDTAAQNERHPVRSG